MAGQKRGGMKKAHLSRVGPRRTLTGVHADGRPLSVSFQVGALRLGLVDLAPRLHPATMLHFPPF
jgi:hypothetical protein